MGKCLVTKLQATTNANLPYIGFVRRKQVGTEKCQNLWFSNWGLNYNFEVKDGAFFGTSKDATSGSTSPTNPSVLGGFLFPSNVGTLLIPKYAEYEFSMFSTDSLETADLDACCKWKGIKFSDGDVIGETCIEMPNLEYISAQSVQFVGKFEDFSKYPSLKRLNIAFGTFNNVMYNRLFTSITEHLPNLEVVLFGNASEAEMPVRTSDMPVLVVQGAGNLLGITLSDANILAYFKNQANCKASDYGKAYPIKIAADSSKVTSIDGLRAAIDVIKAKGYTVQFNGTTV